jgi:hypothetical protein
MLNDAIARFEVEYTLSVFVAYSGAGLFHDPKSINCTCSITRPESRKCQVRKARQRCLLLDNGSLIMFLLQQGAVNSSLPRRQL